MHHALMVIGLVHSVESALLFWSLSFHSRNGKCTPNVESHLPCCLCLYVFAYACMCARARAKQKSLLPVVFGNLLWEICKQKHCHAFHTFPPLSATSHSCRTLLLCIFLAQFRNKVERFLRMCNPGYISIQILRSREKVLEICYIARLFCYPSRCPLPMLHRLAIFRVYVFLRAI